MCVCVCLCVCACESVRVGVWVCEREDQRSWCETVWGASKVFVRERVCVSVCLCSRGGGLGVKEEMNAFWRS